MERDPRTPRPEAAAAVARLADELPLQLVDAGIEARCVGVAFADIRRTVDVELDSAERPTPTSQTEIEEHLEGWESLAPNEFAARWREYATDPYVGVGPGWVGTVDEEGVEHWLKSPDLAEAEQTHPSYSPRHVTLSNLQLIALGPGRYVAVYRVEETYQNGKVSAGNTFAVLMNVRDKGWRIAVASKGTRHEAVLRQE